MPTTKRPKLLTIAELSKLVGDVPFETIRGWQEQGCPFEKTRRGGRGPERVLFDPQAVKAWLDPRGEAPMRRRERKQKAAPSARPKVSVTSIIVPAGGAFTLAEQRAWAPPETLSVSEWTTAHRVIVSKDAAEPGPFRFERAPYLREI